MKEARGYQTQCVEALWSSLSKNRKSIPLASVPVAGGKSFIMALLAQRVLNFAPKAKILYVAHVAELSEQASEELDELLPNISKGYYGDKLRSRDTKSQIILGTVQSLYRKAEDFFGGFDIVFIDEAHTISNKDKSMYDQLFTTLLKKNPNTRIVGFTGTAFRSLKYNLVNEPKPLFTEIAFAIPMLELINKGHLCEVVTPAYLRTRLSAEGVAVRGSDYVESQLQKVVDTPELIKACIDEYLEYFKTRTQGIIFTAGVEHAKHVKEYLISLGENVEIVTGKTPPEERRCIIKDYKVGKIDHLVNCACLTTGFNNPRIDIIANLRPMKSPVLYTQVLGRGMRAFEGKENCLLVDFGGAVDELGPVDTLDARIAVNQNKRLSNQLQLPPTKVCPECDSVNFAATRYCYCCGHQFPESERHTEINREASSGAVISTQEIVREFEVHYMNVKSYTAQGKNIPTLRVEYTVDGFNTINQFIPFEAKYNGLASKWFKGFFPNKPVPKTVAEAEGYNYIKPKKIVCNKNGKYWNVLRVEFPDTLDTILDGDEIPF